MILNSRACGSYQDFLDRGLLLTWKLLNQGFLLVKLKSSLRKFYGRHHDLVDRYGISVTNDHGYVPLVVNTSLSFPYSRLITRLTRRVPLVEQELHTLPVYLSSPPVFSGVRVTRSLDLYVCFVDHCLSFFWPLCCLFFFDIRFLIAPLVSSNFSSKDSLIFLNISFKVLSLSLGLEPDIFILQANSPTTVLLTVNDKLVTVSIHFYIQMLTRGSDEPVSLT